MALAVIIALEMIMQNCSLQVYGFSIYRSVASDIQIHQVTATNLASQSCVRVQHNSAGCGSSLTGIQVLGIDCSLDLTRKDQLHKFAGVCNEVTYGTVLKLVQKAIVFN
jgi:hypothetical protein